MPSVIAQLGQVMLGVVDAAVASRISVHALDAVTLGSVWMVGTMMPLAGIVMGLGSLVSQGHGAGRQDELGLALQRALLLAVALSFAVGACWLNTERGLLWLGQDPELAHAAGGYVRAQLFSAPCYLIYSALTTYLSSRGIVRIGIVTMVVANLFNALAAYSLALGQFGLPALGIQGAALATGLTELLLPCVTAALIVRLNLHANAWIPWGLRVLDRAAMLRQLKLGIPTGVTIALELWAFQLGTILAGRIDHIALGAHAIALNIASMSFMVPLGFSIGTSTHVGQLIGAGERDRAQNAAHTALQLLALYAIAAGSLFVGAREFLPGLYSRDPNIVRAVASVLPIAGAFQLFDGLQAAGSGIMRGMGRPHVTAMFNLVGYFAIGIPLASYLGLHTTLGLCGIWIGYAAGLAFVAAGLVSAVLLRGPRTASLLLAPAEPTAHG
ncbi:MAG TPA: MATE family efflux transporter [Polyangiales bacterium]|nr:MATE family efflux transporter [Polyangiales bacterium]